MYNTLLVGYSLLYSLLCMLPNLPLVGAIKYLPNLAPTLRYRHLACSYFYLLQMYLMESMHQFNSR